MSTTISTSAAVAAAPRSVWLPRFAVVVAAYTLLHIKGGAMVTSTGSGMAFTDWPLADGSFWPPGMDAPKLFEHLHRASGALLGLMAIVLTAWVYRVDGRGWVRRLALGLLGVIVAQGVLGGLGVLLGEEGGVTWAPAAIGHGVLAQPTLCIAALLAFAVSAGWDERVAVAAGPAATARRLALVAIGAVFVQVAIGAVVRHTDRQGMLWLHVFLALAVSLLIMIASAYAAARFGKGVPSFASLHRWTLAVLGLQLVLGFIALAARRVKDPTNIEFIGRSVLVSGHVVGGACLFLLATLLIAKTWRNLQPRA